jgi:hypothetical protein
MTDASHPSYRPVHRSQSPRPAASLLTRMPATTIVPTAVLTVARTAVLTVVLLAALLAADTAVASPPNNPFARAGSSSAAARVGLGNGTRAYTSHHYTIHSDLDRHAVREFASHMDAVFRAFERRFARFEPRSRNPMPLYLFHTEAAYQDFLRSRQIDGANSAGMFFVGPRGRGLAIYVEGQPRSKILATLQHEGFHQFAYDYFGPDLPIWLNEGLAQYFETGVIIGHELRTGMTDSAALHAVQAAVREGRTLPFRELLTDSPERWSRRLAAEPDRARLAYAQSWAMAYFLIHGGDGRFRPRLDDYLRQLNSGSHPDEAFVTAFGNDVDAFERAWRRYVLTLEPDPVNTAADRMAFLAQSLRFLYANQQPIPTDLDELEATLRRLQYRATWRSHGLERQFSGHDSSLYYYNLPNDSPARFQLLEPAADDLLPRITAPGLAPEPTVTWSRDARDDLVSDILYR